MKNNKLSHTIARIISTVFVPPTFTLLLFTYFAVLIEDDVSKMVIIIVNAILFGMLLPIIVFFRLRKESKISDIDASIKEERDAPYLLNSLFCLAAIPPLLFLKTDLLFILIWIILFISTILLYLINKYWKISAHLIAASISLGALLFFNGNINIYLLLLIIAIGWSRLELRVHNIKQILLGGIFGISVSFLTLKILYSIF